MLGAAAGLNRPCPSPLCSCLWPVQAGFQEIFSITNKNSVTTGISLFSFECRQPFYGHEVASMNAKAHMLRAESWKAESGPRMACLTFSTLVSYSPQTSCSRRRGNLYFFNPLSIKLLLPPGSSPNRYWYSSVRPSERLLRPA